jgi:Glycosyl hydrolase family 79 C-terminal beta domain
MLRRSLAYRLALSAVALMLALAASACAVVSQRGGGGGARPAVGAAPVLSTGSARSSAAIVTVAGGRPQLSVPSSFLGLSTEYWTVPVWSKQLVWFGRILSQITPNGPMVLRIGGDSAAQSQWAPTRELPEWAFEIRPAWLSEVSRIVNAFRVRIILDLNLVTATPASAANWAQTAVTHLPPGSVIGFEIGNEPDIYSPAGFKRKAGARKIPRKIEPKMTARQYAAEYAQYDQALDRAVPSIPLMGPAIYSPKQHLGYITRLLAGPHHGLTAVTVHRYPLSACATKGTSAYPTIARVLGEYATAGMANTIKPAVRAARRVHLPVRLTEINSVTCKGARGVSNTFATALWVPDALFEYMKAGARSVAIHVRTDTINRAFSLTPRGVFAFPMFYGMAAFARTLGAHPQLLHTRLQSSPGFHLKAWAVRDGRTLRVMLINKGSNSGFVSLRLQAGGALTLQRLLAPSDAATAGVTLAGQKLGRQGRWIGRRVTQRVMAVGRSYSVWLPGMSAVIATQG